MNIRQMLEREEGRSAVAYTDSEGYLTIGVGRLIDKRKGGRLSDDEIDYLLSNDIKAKTAEVLARLPWVATLNDARQAVVIGMAFQLGTEGVLAFKNTLAAMQAGRWADAKAGMLASRWAQQTPKRVERMAEQMLTGMWQ